MAISNKIAHQHKAAFTVTQAHHFSTFNTLMTEVTDQIKIISDSKKAMYPATSGHHRGERVLSTDHGVTTDLSVRLMWTTYQL